ncbi:MAG: hypothetical protein HW410_1743 [Nitrosarchaeum sp.]|nr:hypothetical protein [Nitrosarchaeum sp.]
MKTRLLIIIGIAIVVAGLTSSFFFIPTNDGHYYPEDLKLTWYDEKIIQDADVIVAAKLAKYENNQWVLGPDHIDIKGNTQDTIIKINTIFSEIILADGKSLKPEINQTYVWFLKNNEDKYSLVSDNGFADEKYYYSIKQAMIKPTIQNSIENKKINLFDPTIPKTSDGLIDYHKLIEIISKPVFVDLFADMGITVPEEDIVLMRGPWILMYTEYSSMCGYALVDEQVYWLQSDLHRDTLTKASILSDNPDPCKPSYGSCFCDAQHDLAEKTITELSYFDKSKEAYVGQTFQNYLNEGGKIVNMPKKFVVGDNNFEMKPDETTFCGAFVSEKGNFGPDRVIRENVVAFRYFSGVIKDNAVVSFSLEDPMKLCAINSDAEVYDFK